MVPQGVPKKKEPCGSLNGDSSVREGKDHDQALNRLLTRAELRRVRWTFSRDGRYSSRSAVSHTVVVVGSC
jgi:hypothetical protein